MKYYVHKRKCRFYVCFKDEGNNIPVTGGYHFPSEAQEYADTLNKQQGDKVNDD